MLYPLKENGLAQFDHWRNDGHGRLALLGLQAGLSRDRCASPHGSQSFRADRDSCLRSTHGS